MFAIRSGAGPSVAGPSVAGPLSLGTTLDRRTGSAVAPALAGSKGVSGCDVCGTIEVPPTPPDVSGTTVSGCVSGCVVATIEVPPAPAPATYCAGCREPFFLPDKTHLNRKAL